MTYRQRANSILALSFLCFIIAFVWWFNYGGGFLTKLIFFVFQSALIGSIADWFAVTALFEKPLGFSYHTELVYRNRDQLIDAMTKAVSEKLLSPNMWQERLWKFSLVDRLQKWLSSEDGREKFRALLFQIAQQVYNYARRNNTQEAMAGHIRGYLKQQPLMIFLQDRVIDLLENPDGKMLNSMIDLTKECVRSKAFEAYVKRGLDNWIEETRYGAHVVVAINKITGMIDTAKISQDIVLGLSAWLDKWEHADYEERKWLCQKLEIQLYSMNGQLTYTIQHWQDEFVDSLPIEMWLNNILRSSSAYFTTGEEGKQKLAMVMEQEFMRYVDYCGEYPEIKGWLDDQIRKACAIILENEHSLIGVAVKQVLSSFDKKRFNEFLESKVGEDLAWIRINGAIVGGTIGILVFLFTELLYAPYIAPLIRSLVM